MQLTVYFMSMCGRLPRHNIRPLYIFTVTGIDIGVSLLKVVGH
jgi:hypothetical protein